MPAAGVKKLAPHLFKQEHYVGHVAALQAYLQIGGSIGQIHRVLEFDQRPWLKTYIDFNTQRRQAATTKFEKNYFKLMNNRLLALFSTPPILSVTSLYLFGFISVGYYL